METEKYENIKHQIRLNVKIGQQYSDFVRTFKVIELVSLNKRNESTLNDFQRWNLYLTMVREYHTDYAPLHNAIYTESIDWRNHNGWSLDSQHRFLKAVKILFDQRDERVAKQSAK